MTFESVKEMTDAVKPAAAVLSDRLRVPLRVLLGALAEAPGGVERG